MARPSLVKETKRDIQNCTPPDTACWCERSLHNPVELLKMSSIPSVQITDKERIKLRIAFVGLKEAGKTSILKRLIKGDFAPTKPTMGFNVDSFVYRGISVRATDLGGQRVFIDAFWKTFIPQSEAIIFVVDATNLVQMHQAKESLDLCLAWTQAQPLLVVLANKQDLPRSISKEEIIRRFKLDSIPEGSVRAVEVFATSAKTGQGIHPAFGWIINNLTGDIKLPRVCLNSIFVYTILKGDEIISVARIQNDMREEEVAVAVRMYQDLPSLVRKVDAFNGVHLINDDDRMQYKLIQMEDPASRLGCLVMVHEEDHPNSVEYVAKEVLWLILQTYPGIDSERVLNHVRPFLTLPEHLGWMAPTQISEKVYKVSKPIESRQKDSDSLIRPSERLARELGTFIDPEEERLIKPSERLTAESEAGKIKAKDVGFFTKLSIGDRVKAIEKKGLHGVSK